MKFFIDSADTALISSAAQTGLLDGVTTNPSLVASAGKSYESLVAHICELCKGPISAEVLAVDLEGMLKEARAWSKVAPNIVVKIPLTLEGLKAVKICSQEGIPTNVTLCFSPLQALAAAKAGATYISPFIGRLDDISTEGMKLIEDILTIYRHYDIQTQVLVASIRSLGQVLASAKLGAHCVTIPPKIFDQLLQHPLTDAGLAVFMKDALRIPKE